VLVECGFVQVTAGDDGRAWSFSPSLGRLAALGSPPELVALYAALHGPNAPQEAAYVLAGFCDQEDAADLIGCHAESGWFDGLMPAGDRVIIAQHLMHHAMVGKARPDGEAPAERGQYAPEFRVSEFLALARVHLGMSAADAEALSMTELQQLLDVKFPQKAARPVASREEYDAAMRHFDELAARRKAAKAAQGVQ
jgi:hypothetical protein